MIYIDFTIENPYPKNDFKNIWFKGGSISKFKAWELQLYKDPECLLSFGFRFSFRGHDHAGLRINFGLFKYRFDTQIYDTRHWNYETNSW